VTRFRAHLPKPHRSVVAQLLDQFTSSLGEKLKGERRGTRKGIYRFPDDQLPGASTAVPVRKCPRHSKFGLPLGTVHPIMWIRINRAGRASPARLLTQLDRILPPPLRYLNVRTCFTRLFNLHSYFTRRSLIAAVRAFATTNDYLPLLFADKFGQAFFCLSVCVCVCVCVCACSPIRNED
jgi:hypothetical protein